MGGKQSQPGPADSEEIPKVNHPRFQNIKLIGRKDNEEENFIEVKIPVANIKEYNQWVQRLKDAPTESENFLLPQKHDFQKQGFCGSSGYVNILFQNFPYVLADEIRNRAQLKQKFFDEPELWYLIYTLLSAGHEFHKNGKKAGDIRPENVFINEDGQVKVATQLTWPSENINYQKTFYQKQTTYLAPEQLKDIQFAKMEPSCDPKLAQSFSVGLTCLDAGTLSSSNSLYLKNSKFDYNGLSEKIAQLQNAGYSQILCLVVSNLCEPDSDKRSTCSELYKWLEPHEGNIINLERFQVTNLPQKFAYFGGSQQVSQQQSSPGINQSVIPPVNQVPQSVSYSASTPQPPYINGSQNVRVQEQYHYSVPQPQPFGQQVTYYQVPPQQIPIPQQQVKPQIPQQQVFQIPVDQVGQQPGKITQNRTTTSTYTYTQYQPASQYIPGPPGNQYTAQTVQYSRPVSNIYQGSEGGDRPKSNMELTLEKIDEQLQMSRKMFPS